MITTRNQILALSPLLIGLLSGCDSAIDCLDGDGPVFDKKSISNPVLNQVYSDSIRVSIENEPRDDRFSYNFVFSGVLPAGLSTVEQGRDFIFQGTPTELGTFSFNLFVEVEDSFNADNSGLCYTTRSRTFGITVQQGT